MTTENTQAPVEAGPASDNGQGQSQGHRRRRRRRKNKSQNPAAQQTQAPQQVQAQPAPPPTRQKTQQQPQLRKKKFFQKGQSQQAQPGNGSVPQQAKQRKPRQQKAPREFVGPMDHSYRVANGNVAEGPASTIPLGGSRMTHWEEPYMQPAQIRHDAPTRIYCFIEDLFFTAKIQDTAKKLGVKVEFAKGDKESIARLLELPVEERPALMVFDLNNANAKPLTLIPKFKTKFKKTVSMVGFLSHLQGDLKAKAVEAGCDTVMPRSAFSQGLPNMLRRYGIDDEEDEGQQPF